MKVYAEFKPCYKTTYRFGEGGRGTILRDMMNISDACFIDGTAYGGTLFITADLRYVYFLYNSEYSFYRVTNVSSKPIDWKRDRVKEWHRITAKINELKNQRCKLVHP